jgi:hypothetical protein
VAEPGFHPRGDATTRDLPELGVGPIGYGFMGPRPRAVSTEHLAPESAP